MWRLLSFVVALIAAFAFAAPVPAAVDTGPIDTNMYKCTSAESARPAAAVHYDPGRQATTMDTFYSDHVGAVARGSTSSGETPRATFGLSGEIKPVRNEMTGRLYRLVTDHDVGTLPRQYAEHPLPAPNLWRT